MQREAGRCEAFVRESGTSLGAAGWRQSVCFGIWRNSAGGHRYQRQRKWLLTDECRQGL